VDADGPPTIYFGQTQPEGKNAFEQPADNSLKVAGSITSTLLDWTSGT
jgi:hypothetical protein